MKFVDYVTITVRSGSGGAGAVAFRREKYVPRGGPSGGDGGKGGSVIIVADRQLNTLVDLRYKRHHFAKSGESGRGDLKHGKDGDDIILRVPPGTVASHTGDDTVVGEVVGDGDQLILAPGGRGGKGNAFFKSPTNRSPQHAQPGESGQEIPITLQLKLLADVGLVGFPNAGKSTLISVLSDARPKIADYPFTTLTPSLGVVRCEDYKSFVMADIPGIIEDAHKGKGLGIQFLKHIERNAVLAFIIPIDSKDPAREYRLLLQELVAYDADLGAKPRVIVITKTDIIGPDLDDMMELLKPEFDRRIPLLSVSAVSRDGLMPLKRLLLQLVETNRQLD